MSILETRPRGNYVGGKFLDGGTPVRSVNPSDLTDVVGTFSYAQADLTHQAIAHAQEAAFAWGRCGVQTRFEILDRVGSEILARKDELGSLLAREEGKILAEATGEVVRAGQIFKFFAGEALRAGGELFASTRPGIDVEITREPVGVVAIITPWNFPIAIPAWKIAPALAYGNCVVFKPSELVPGCAWALSEILARSGLPAGVFNLVMGDGPSVGNALVTSPGIDAISFTGSAATGEQIACTAVALHKRVQLEMGGKNPIVVLDDADLDVAVECAINGAYFSTGQRCTASSRIIVTQGIHDRFVDALIERLIHLRVGSALDPSTHIGPVVDERQLEKNLQYVRIGIEEGARLRCGGERLELTPAGHYMRPALFTETSPRMRINLDEIFGPIACVIRADDYDEALAMANDTPYGLSAGICTRSQKYAAAFKRDSQAGMVMINVPTAGVDYHVPFGGRKRSSYGPREQGSYAREFYTVVKTAYIRAL